jgi:ABC-type glycerol-3-phosphate transport system permease component
MPPPPLRLRKSENRTTSLLLQLFLIATATITIIPFLWLICATFKTPRDASNYAFLPNNLKNLTLENYTTLLHDQPFARWMINSLFLASTHTLLVVTLSALGGFALAKYRFKARTPLMFIMLITLLVPA